MPAKRSQPVNASAWAGSVWIPGRDLAAGSIGRPETIAVLSLIVQLAKTLHLSIVAEGIETQEQLEKICSLGIGLGQGYVFSKPVPLAELDRQSLAARERQAVA